MHAGDASELSPGRRRVGTVVMTLMAAAIVVHLAVYATSWGAGSASLWAGGLPRLLKAGASLVTVLALLGMLVLPVTGGHWPGLLAGPRARAAGWLGLGLFACLIAAHELTFRLQPAGEVSTWTNETELRANTLYQLLVFVLSVPLLCGSRRGDSVSPPGED